MTRMKQEQDEGLAVEILGLTGAESGNGLAAVWANTAAQQQQHRRNQRMVHPNEMGNNRDQHAEAPSARIVAQEHDEEQVVRILSLTREISGGSGVAVNGELVEVADGDTKAARSKKHKKKKKKKEKKQSKRSKQSKKKLEDDLTVASTVLTQDTGFSGQQDHPENDVELGSNLNTIPPPTNSNVPSSQTQLSATNLERGHEYQRRPGAFRVWGNRRPRREDDDDSSSNDEEDHQENQSRLPPLAAVERVRTRTSRRGDDREEDHAEEPFDEDEEDKASEDEEEEEDNSDDYFWMFVAAFVAVLVLVGAITITTVLAKGKGGGTSSSTSETDSSTTDAGDSNIFGEVDSSELDPMNSHSNVFIYALQLGLDRSGCHDEEQMPQEPEFFMKCSDGGVIGILGAKYLDAENRREDFNFAACQPDPDHPASVRVCSTKEDETAAKIDVISIVWIVGCASDGAETILTARSEYTSDSTPVTCQRGGSTTSSSSHLSHSLGIVSVCTASKTTYSFNENVVCFQGSPAEVNGYPFCEEHSSCGMIDADLDSCSIDNIGSVEAQGASPECSIRKDRGESVSNFLDVNALGRNLFSEFGFETHSIMTWSP